MMDGRRQFYSKVREVECDAFVITGDIGEAPSVARYLRELARALAAPIYFVLGNHDFLLRLDEQRAAEDVAAGSENSKSDVAQ